MIVMRRAHEPLLVRLHCVSLFGETLRVGVQNPILRSMNSRAGQGDNNSGGLGVPCITHSERPAFGSSPVPHQILSLLSVISSRTARPGRVTLFTACGFASVGSADVVEAVKSAVFGGVTRCCCNCKYTMWEKVFCVFHKVLQILCMFRLRFHCAKRIFRNPTSLLL